MTASPSTGFHLIFGTGPVACWTAHHLRAKGVAVKAVNRSGQRPALMPADVGIIRADLSDAQQAIQVAQGASVVYQALGPAYAQWAALFPRLQANTLAAAAQASAQYVALENLYMLDAGQPMTEHSAEAPRSVKGRLRQQMHHDLMARQRLLWPWRHGVSHGRACVWQPDERLRRHAQTRGRRCVNTHRADVDQDRLCASGSPLTTQGRAGTCVGYKACGGVMFSGYTRSIFSATTKNISN